MQDEIKPIEDKEKKQIVYMVPSTDFEEDEIDLWQLFLPLVKYKLQILLFLIVGIAIGVGWNWKKNQSNQGIDNRFIIGDLSRTTEVKKSFEAKLKFLELEKEVLYAKLMEAIDRIPDDKQVLRIVAAEYQYRLLDKPEATKTVILDKTELLNPNLMNTNPVDYTVFLIVERADTSELKKDLIKNYEDYIKLAASAESIKINRSKVLNALAQSDLKAKEQKTEDLKKASLLIKSNKENPQIDVLNYQIITNTNEAKKKMAEATNILNTYVDNVFFETNNSKIPLTVWNDFKKQFHNNIKDSDMVEYQQAEKIKVSFQAYLDMVLNIESYKAALHLSNDESKNIKTIKEILPKLKEDPAFAQPKAYKIVNKYSAVAVLVALFIGIVSVYLRLFFSKIKIEGGGFEKRKQEFIEALRFWKL